MLLRLPGFLITLVLVLTPRAPATVYALTPLPRNTPYYISDDGTVCGHHNGRAKVWTASGDCTTIMPPSGFYYTKATVVDPSGEVCGTAYNQHPPYSAQVFRRDPTEGLVVLGLGRLQFNDVNHAGLFVAESGRFAPYQTYRGHTWSPATGLQELPPLAGETHCIAKAINDDASLSGVAGRRARLPLFLSDGAPQTFPKVSRF